MGPEVRTGPTKRYPTKGETPGPDRCPLTGAKTRKSSPETPQAGGGHGSAAGQGEELGRASLTPPCSGGTTRAAAAAHLSRELQPSIARFAAPLPARFGTIGSGGRPGRVQRTSIPSSPRAAALASPWPAPHSACWEL